MDDFDIAHSLKLADIVSARVYRQGYQEQMVGKAPSDPSLQSYMNEAKAVENSRNQSIANYVKSGKQIMTTGKLPNDCMEFERIKKNALNMSDSLYRQSRIKAIKDHKAWQTMDSATHPLVVERQIANLRNSHAAYTEEAKQILDSVYYPVFITEGYELAKKVTAA